MVQRWACALDHIENWEFSEDKPVSIKLTKNADVDEVWVRVIWRKAVIEAKKIGEWRKEAEHRRKRIKMDDE